MSAPPPRSVPPRRTVQPVAMPLGQYASQGMIAPSNPFVNGDGTLSSVSFRFLHGLFQQLNDLQNQVGALQQRLTNAGL